MIGPYCRGSVRRRVAGVRGRCCGGPPVSGPARRPVADVADRGADVRIGGAAADVPAHELADVLLGGGVALLDQLERGHDLPRGAVAALERVVFDERALHRMELVTVGEPFDRDDLVPGSGDREGQAGEHPAAVDPHGAGPARALITALLAPREIQVLAECVQQADPRLQVDDVPSAVDLERHPNAPRSFNVPMNVEKCHGAASPTAGMSREHLAVSRTFVPGSPPGGSLVPPWTCLTPGDHPVTAGPASSGDDQRARAG